MLTRLHVRGFKNLVDVDVRLGPFTCIAGINGVGKSNLFDAILFLSALADRSLLEAATGVRQESSSSNAARIISRGKHMSLHEMSFEAEMIVPRVARDDLDQDATASTTTLRYTVRLRLDDAGSARIPKIELLHEELNYATKTAAQEALPFARGKKEWLESVLHGRRGSPLISTERTNEGTFIKVHEDSGHQGRSRKLRADGLARTILSTMNTAENPTALVARRELQSWRLLQLEPSRLRAPDELKATPRLGADGRGLPATLHRLLTRPGVDAEAVRAQLVNRLSELIEDIRDVRVDLDEKRELLTIVASDREGTEFRARDLSDGTLRFLALAVLEMDPEWGGVLCMEEPENGIHPTRVHAMLSLVQDIAVDLAGPVDETNPLRQVLINTHSPEVVALVPEDSVLFAEPVTVKEGAGTLRGVAFRPLDGTWRARSSTRSVSKGTVLEYLQPTSAALAESSNGIGRGSVAARPEIRQLLLPLRAKGG